MMFPVSLRTIELSFSSYCVLLNYLMKTDRVHVNLIFFLLGFSNDLIKAVSSMRLKGLNLSYRRALIRSWIDLVFHYPIRWLILVSTLDFLESDIHGVQDLEIITHPTWFRPERQWFRNEKRIWVSQIINRSLRLILLAQSVRNLNLWNSRNSLNDWVLPLACIFPWLIGYESDLMIVIHLRSQLNRSIMKMMNELMSGRMIAGGNWNCHRLCMGWVIEREVMNCARSLSLLLDIEDLKFILLSWLVLLSVLQFIGIYLILKRNLIKGLVLPVGIIDRMSRNWHRDGLKGLIP